VQPLGDGVWRLEHEYQYPVMGLWATVPAGFEYDLASVPRALTPFIQPDELGRSAPLVHDWLYQNHGLFAALEAPLKRRQVDALFRLLMLLEQVPAWRRYWAWLAVRLGGWLAWRS
jgi:hypothetical protein